MRTALRCCVTAAAAVATYYIVYWVPAHLIPPETWPFWVPKAGSLLCAIAAAAFVWRGTSAVSKGPVRLILLGAIMVGALGFIVGFFGPIILTPNSNQGPLLGIFITGPAGVLVGAVAGWVYWYAHRKGGSQGVPTGHTTSGNRQDGP